MEEILNGGEITKRVKQELTYRDIDDSVENVWSVLYATGYLTGKHVEGADADIFRLWIPNGEICKLFSDLVQDWFREVMRSDSARINRFCAAFPAGDVATIQDMPPRLSVGFHQRAGYSGPDKHERKFLSRHAAGAFEKSGQLAGQIQRGDGGRLQRYFYPDAGEDRNRDRAEVCG